jgi:hypothetical protein
MSRHVVTFAGNHSAFIVDFSFHLRNRAPGTFE